MDHHSSPAVNLCEADGCTSRLTVSARVCRVCDSHAAEVFAALCRVPGLETELEVTRARQDRLQAAAECGRAAELPLAFSWRGAEAAWALENTLTAAAADLARVLGEPLDEHGHPAVLATVRVNPGPRHARGHTIAVPARTTTRVVEHADEVTGRRSTTSITHVAPARYHDDPAAIIPPPGLAARAATWLALHLDHLLCHPDAARLVDEITHVVGRTRHVIDRAPARWYAGACDHCGTAMYARPGAREVICPNRDCEVETTPAHCPIHGEVGDWCATCPASAAVVERPRYDVADRRAWMLAAAEDYMATAVEATAAVPHLVEGLEINVNTLRQAARPRGTRPPELYPDHTHPDGRARYRLGDVIDLARRIAVRRAG